MFGGTSPSLTRIGKCQKQTAGVSGGGGHEDSLGARICYRGGNKRSASRLRPCLNLECWLRGFVNAQAPGFLSGFAKDGNGSGGGAGSGK